MCRIPRLKWSKKVGGVIAKIELARYALGTLWDYGEFVLSRSVRDGELSLLLVVTLVLNSRHPRVSSGSSVRMRFEMDWKPQAGRIAFGLSAG